MADDPYIRNVLSVLLLSWMVMFLLPIFKMTIDYFIRNLKLCKLPTIQAHEWPSRNECIQINSCAKSFAQILIWFIAYIFPFLKSSVWTVGALHLWNVPVAFHHCYCDQNEAPARCNETSQHPLLGGQALMFCGDDRTGKLVMEPAPLTD